MEDKINLITCLSILYRETKLEQKETYKSLIEEVVAGIATPAIVNAGDGSSSIIGMKQIVSDILYGQYPFDRNNVIRKLKLYLTLDRKLLSIIEDALPEGLSDNLDELKKENAQAASELRFNKRRTAFRKLVSKASYNLDKNPNTDFNKLLNEFRDDVSKISTVTKTVRSGFIESFGTGSAESVSNIFEKTQESISGASLRSGWKGLNRMCGINGGFQPGELWLLPALPHSGKTTLSLIIFISFGLFNDAKDFVDDGKKALMLDISLENDLKVNLPIAYKFIFENLYNKKIDIRDINPAEAAAEFCKVLSKRGWNYQFERFTNSDFNIHTLRETFEHYESTGHQIVWSRLDYLGTVNKEGLGNGITGTDVKDLYRLARNLAVPRGMGLFCPHQLSPKAKEMRALDPLRFVRNLPGKGMYENCTSLDNEADGELYFGITEHNKKSFMEIQRGKHRTIEDTPIKDRYIVLPFAEHGIIPFDLDKDYEVTLKSVMAGPGADDSDEVFDF